MSTTLSTALEVKRIASKYYPELKLNFVEGQTVKKVTRVRSNEEGAPYAFYISWTVGVTDGFTKENLESTPRLNIIRENGIQLTKVEQTLGARNASM